MTYVKDLDVDKVMAKSVSRLCYHLSEEDLCVACMSASLVNSIVSQNDKLVLLINEDKLADLIYQTGNIDEWKNCQEISKHLKSTIKQWAKIGVEK